MSSERSVHERLIAAGKTLSLAESCTGGRLASRLTALPGASKYFLGSLVVYSNQLKQQILGVPDAVLQTHGAVSPEVVEQMVLGLLDLTGSDYGIAVTGIAGPEGGTLEKPVGTVWFAIKTPDQPPIIWHHQFQGNRISIMEASVDQALLRLSQIL